jgi:hypothetical protein
LVGFGFSALMLVHEANQPPTNFNDSGDTTVFDQQPMNGTPHADFCGCTPFGRAPIAAGFAARFYPRNHALPDELRDLQMAAGQGDAPPTVGLWCARGWRFHPS